MSLEKMASKNLKQVADLKMPKNITQKVET